MRDKPPPPSSGQPSNPEHPDPARHPSPPAGASSGASDATSAPDSPAPTVDRPSPRLLEFLVCPQTRTTLELSPDRTELISRAAHLVYPIRDGIPLLTKDAARPLEDHEFPPRYRPR